MTKTMTVAFGEIEAGIRRLAADSPDWHHKGSWLDGYGTMWSYGDHDSPFGEVFRRLGAPQDGGGSIGERLRAVGVAADWRQRRWAETVQRIAASRSGDGRCRTLSEAVGVADRD